MISKIKEIFSPSPKEERKQGDVRVAACALLLEIAAADRNFSSEERERIITIMQNDFGLGEEEAAEIMATADREIEGSVDLWSFTSRINENYSKEEKLRVMEMVWEVVYADGQLDAHEEYLARKLADLLRLKHRELINTKLKVKKARRD